MATSESTYTQWYHKKLKMQGVYCLKLNLMHSNGVPDSYFSGNLDDCWVEWKYIRELPKRPATVVPFNLTSLQQHWITSRCNEGRLVYLVVGSPHHHNIIHGSKIHNLTTEEFMKASMPREQVCQQILDTIQG